MEIKKNIATMTWIRNNNYGSILQAYALQKILLNSGYKNEIIDYNPSKLDRTINLFKSHNSLKWFYVKFKDFISKKRSRSVGHDISGKYLKFDEFANTYLIRTKEYKKIEELRLLSGKYDAYICGSDQIWNPNLLNPPYYFSFLNDNDKKISYSPSFGVKQIKSSKKKKIIKKYLDKFSSISVREEQGKNILTDLGINVENIPVVLDPTLLLNVEQWSKLIKENKICNDEYLVCYFLGENENYWKSAQNIAKELNLKIFIIPNCEDSYIQKNMIIGDDIGPIEWLSLIKNSKVVLTDSYHGILFSIIFNKCFYAYKRFEDNLRESQNSRVENILKKLKLEKRLYAKTEIIDEINDDLDYRETKEKLEKYRERSINYLLNSIES